MAEKSRKNLCILFGILSFPDLSESVPNSNLSPPSVSPLIPYLYSNSNLNSNLSYLSSPPSFRICSKLKLKLKLKLIFPLRAQARQTGRILTTSDQLLVKPSKGVCAYSLYFLHLQISQNLAHISHCYIVSARASFRINHKRSPRGPPPFPVWRPP